MNKLHLLGILIMFLTGLLLGYGFGNKKEVNFFGARETALLTKIDSLKSEIDSSEVRIVEIEKVRTRIKTKYERDTIWITTAPFDSLEVLFLSKYPR